MATATVTGAPYQWLKSRILMRPEFVGPAGRLFILVDIEDLVGRPMATGRKELYQAPPQRFGIQAFPWWSWRPPTASPMPGP